MDPLQAIRHNRAKNTEAERLRKVLADELQLLVKAAFDAGYTGVEIAEAARVSKQRTYQLRDGGGGGPRHRMPRCAQCGRVVHTGSALCDYCLEGTAQLPTDS